MLTAKPLCWVCENNEGWIWFGSGFGCSDCFKKFNDKKNDMIKDMILSDKK